MAVILIVGGATSQVRTMTELLERHGYAVAVANGDAELFEQVHRRHPVLVVAGAMAPDLGALDVCRRVKECTATRETPVILLVEDGDFATRRGCFDAGASDYIPLPIHDAEALARIRAHAPSGGVTEPEVYAKPRIEEGAATDAPFLESLDRVNRAIQGAAEPGKVLGAVLESVVEIFQCDSAWLVDARVGKPGFAGALIAGKRSDGLAPSADAAVRSSDASVERAVQAVLGAAAPVRLGHGGGFSAPPLSILSSEVVSQIAVAIRPKTAGSYVFGLDQCTRTRVWTPQEERLFVEIGLRLADSLSTLLVYRDLLESEQRLTLALDVAGLGAYDYDMDTGEAVWTKRMAEFWQYVERGPGNEFIRHCWDHIHPDDVARAKSEFARVMENHEDANVDLRVVRPDGTLRWIRWRGRAIRNQSGEYRRRIGVNLDITAQKQAEEERAQLQQQLLQAQRMESIGRLAGGVAHDFNNLLTVIGGYGRMLLEVMPVAHEYRVPVEEITKAADKASALTGQLLAFSRRQVIQPRPVDLNAVIDDLRRMTARLLGEDIELQTALEAQLWPVLADPGQLSQVLMNLLVNARDAMPNGGKVILETSNVELDSSYCTVHPEVRAGQYVLLTVSDTGLGMDEQTRQLIFEPFFTTKEKGKGTGLGLSTVYGIVRQNGGWIWVYSEPGQGTTFKIYMPRTGAQEMPDVQPSAHERVRHDGATILLVEDQEEVRLLTRSVLAMRGYQILETGSANAALAAAECHEGFIHLLLTDVILPDFNGKVLAERLRKSRPDMRVLYMSGYTANVIAHRGVLEPGIAYLPKPFSPHALVTKVEEVLSVPGLSS